MEKTVERSYRRLGRGAAGTETKSGNKTVSVAFTPKQHKTLNRYAKQENLSFGEAVRQCVDQYLMS